MHTLSIKRFGFAVGAVSALLYLGCMFVMVTVPKDAVIRFFNSLMHGVDVAPIMRLGYALVGSGHRRAGNLHPGLAGRGGPGNVLQSRASKKLRGRSTTHTATAFPCQRRYVQSVSRHYGTM